jgi:hypothetical protein
MYKSVKPVVLIVKRAGRNNWNSSCFKTKSLQSFDWRLFAFMGMSVRPSHDVVCPDIMGHGAFNIIFRLFVVSVRPDIRTP